MKYHSFFLSILFIQLFTQPLSATDQEQTSSLKPFMWGTAVGAAGVGIAVATRGKFKVPSRNLMSKLPWNRHQAELKEIRKQLSNLSQKQTNDATRLTTIETTLSKQGQKLDVQQASLDAHGKILQTVNSTANSIKEDVEVIKPQIDTIEGQTEQMSQQMNLITRQICEMHGVMQTLLQDKSGVFRNLLSWFSSPRDIITPEAPKAIRKIGSEKL